MDLEALYCPPLTPADRTLLRDRLAAANAEMLTGAISELRDAKTREKLGDRAPAFRDVAREILSLAEGQPSRFAELASHWAVGFLFSRLADGTSAGPEQLDRSLTSLSALLLAQHLANGGKAEDSAPSAYTTRGAVYDLLHNRHLQLRNVSTNGDRLRWTLAGDRLEIRADATQQVLADCTLPMSAAADVEASPLPVLPGWGLPIIEDCTAVGIPEFKPRPDDERYAPTEGYVPLAMAESLTEAHRILAELWPEELAWASVFVPAFVDMGGPPSKSVHRSASYGSGTPIFLTKVGDAFEHAEDIVHELQHERLFLQLDPAAFGTWNDHRQRYVSPYRSDPRPLRGLHLGIHAFVTVNALRLRGLAAGYEMPDTRLYQMLKTHRMNLFSFRTTVEFESFGEKGEKLYVEIARALSRQHEEIEAAAKPEMGEAFDRILDQHVQNVRSSAEESLNADPLYRDWNATAALARRIAERGGVH